MKNLLAFLKKQKLMSIASHDQQDIWLANVFFVIDEKGIIYFISPKDTRHSQMILKNPNIAFSMAWFNPNNQKDRKSVQGLGTCRPAKNPIEISTGVKLLYENFPDLTEYLTIKWIKKNVWGTKVWVLKPTFLKYYDDKIYGDQESEEFIIK